jgi:hypothetical protein
MQKILDYIKSNSITISTNLMLVLFIIICLVCIKQIFENYKNPPELKQYSGIQNHLVWSVKGECYFVRPHNDYTIYLVRTEDCDKK